MKKTSYWPILNIPEDTLGQFSIRHRRYAAEYEFATATARTIIFGQKSEPVQFKRSVRFHELHHTERGTWMTDLPAEQTQANNMVREYTGTVLVGGLGLGYAASRIAMNPDVGFVKVIEISQEVIALVEPHLPDKARAKMEVICMDLFDYLKGMGGHLPHMFDHAFYDIWQSDGEGTFFDTVVPLLNMSKRIRNQPDCWNEDVMRGQLFYSLHCNIEFITHVGPGTNNQPTLDDLCTEKGTIYWDWKVPFFQWYRELLPNIMLSVSDPRIQQAMSLYTQVYGRPIFNAAWPAALDHCG